MRPAVEHVFTALVVPLPGRFEAVHHGRHQRGAIGHGSVDDLATPGMPRLVERAQHTERQQHRTATEIADIVERRHRRLARTPDGVQRTGDRDVVDVVPGDLRQRPVLAPAGHAAVNKTRIARVAFGRPQPEPLHDTGAKAFDQHVGIRHDVEHLLRCASRAQVDAQRAAPARKDVVRIVRRAGPRNANDLGAHVSKQHGAKRGGADACHLDHPEPLERTCHRCSPSAPGRRPLLWSVYLGAGIVRLPSSETTNLG